MADAADYRRRAQDCAHRAEQAQDEYHRKNFQHLATMWTEMADKAEGRAAADGDGTDRETLDDALATIRNA